MKASLSNLKNMVLNNGIKFQKTKQKNIGRLIDQTPSKKVIFHEKRAIAPESMVPYGPLSHIQDAICHDNPKSAYAISSFPPTGYQPAVMITGSNVC